MAFCTSCGEELPAGSKFCENCGAPVEQVPGPVTEPQFPPAAPPAPLPRQPLVPSPPPAKPLPLVPIVAVLFLILVLAAGAWFVGLPYLQKAGIGLAPAPAPAVVPTPPPVTLPPASTLETPVPWVTPTGTVRKLDPRYEEYYDEIYTLDQFFAFGQKETFSHDLTTPPLFIKFNLTPKMISRTKVINIGLSSEETIVVTYPNPNAWFEIKIIDAGNGAVVEAKGYGKDYPDVTKSEFMVRNPGNYLVEMSGNDVTADISIMKGKS